MLPQILKLQPSLAFRGNLPRHFANSRGRHKNTNTSLGSFSGSERQNCSTTRIGLRATPHNIKANDGNEAAEQLTSQCVSKERENTKKYLFFFFWGDSYSRIFAFRWGSWNIAPPRNARKECNVSLVSSLHCLVRSKWSHSTEKLNSQTLSLFAARYDSFNRNSFWWKTGCYLPFKISSSIQQRFKIFHHFYQH